MFSFGYNFVFNEEALLIQNELFYLLIEIQICKTLEDLLKRSLTYWILVYVVLFLKFVDHSEHLSYRFVVAGHSQPHVVSVLFQLLQAAKWLNDGLDRSE